MANPHNNTHPALGQSDSPESSSHQRTSATRRSVAYLDDEQRSRKRAIDRRSQRALRERTRQQIKDLENRLMGQPSNDALLKRLEDESLERGRLVKENESLRNQLDMLLPLCHRISVVGADQSISSADQILLPSMPSGADSSSLFQEQSLSEPEPEISTPSESDHVLCLPLQHPASDIFRQSTPGDEIPSWRLQCNNCGTAIGVYSYYNTELSRCGDGAQISWPTAAFELIDNLGTTRSDSEAATHTWSNPRPPSPVSPAANIKLHTSTELLRLRYIDPNFFQVLPWNIEPTVLSDRILQDFVAARRNMAARGASLYDLVGPKEPDLTQLLNPLIEADIDPISLLVISILKAFKGIETLPEKVAISYVMYRYLNWRIWPSKNTFERLPEWLRPLPIQLRVAHPAWMDRIPWPQARVLLISNQELFGFQSFSVSYTSSISIQWKYSSSNVLIPLRQGKANDNHLTINPIFEEHIRDLENWTLGSDFQTKFSMLWEGINKKE